MNTTQTPVIASSIVPYLNSILKTFNLYASIFILVPGLILNIFVLRVFLRKKFWTKTTMGYYYTLTSVFSISSCIVGIITFFPASLNFDFQLQSNFLCQIIWFARVEAILGSGYNHIMLTLDRTLSTIYFNKFAFLKKVSNLFKCTLIIHTLVAGSNMIQWMRFVKYTPVAAAGNSTTMVVTCTMRSDFLIVYSFEAIASRLGTSLSTLTLNVILIRALIKSKRQTSTTNSISIKEYYFAYSLIAQNFIFFVLTLPQVSIALIQINYSLNDPSADYANVINVLFSYVAWGNYLFESLPFFMHLAFNKLFRAELPSVRIWAAGSEGSAPNTF